MRMFLELEEQQFLLGWRYFAFFQVIYVKRKSLKRNYNRRKKNSLPEKVLALVRCMV